MSKQPPLIAIVDDEEPVRKALSRLLDSAGLAVETYGCGREFLAGWRSSRPACVVLDLHMPDITGFEVLALLEEEEADLPVVVITGHHSIDAKERVMRRGASTLLQKPVKDGVLLAAIETAIEARGAKTDTQP